MSTSSRSLSRVLPAALGLFAVFALLAMLLPPLAARPAAAAAGDSRGKPVLLYSRYFNAKGEDRYPADGTFRDVLGKLRESFDVRVNDEPLNAQTLKGVA